MDNREQCSLTDLVYKGLIPLPKTDKNKTSVIKVPSRRRKNEDETHLFKPSRFAYQESEDIYRSQLGEKVSLPKTDQNGTPVTKMPSCFNCKEDELGMIRAGYACCYACGSNFIRCFSDIP